MHLGCLCHYQRPSAEGSSNRLTPKVDTANVCTVIEPKDCSCLIERDVLGQAHDVPIESTADKVKLELVSREQAHGAGWLTHIRKDESLCRIEADGNDVLCVAVAVPLDLLDSPLFREEISDEDAVKRDLEDQEEESHFSSSVNIMTSYVSCVSHYATPHVDYISRVSTYRHIECILEPCHIRHQ